MQVGIIADPSRAVVRPFHVAWQASGPDLKRVQKLAQDILALDSLIASPTASR
jgi:hypothetical protein